MSEQQPELRWAPLPPKPRHRGRVWLIVGLSIAAVGIVAVVLFFLVPRGGEPTPTGSPSSTPSPAASTTPTESPTSAPEPTAPVDTPPPVPDPDFETFATLIQPRLDDATTGLSIASGTSGQDAVAIVDQLQQDADRLSGSVAPSSIADAWYDAVSQYAARLEELRSAFQSSSDAEPALGASGVALQELRNLVGL